MSNPLLEAALQYHNEGLCVIPVGYRDKKPALATWEEYHTRLSTEQEIRRWWSSGHNYNLGIVHGEVSGNYITLDLDHDSGLVDEMYNAHPHLFKGRIEQSGSGEGYHVPLRLDQLPDFGTDQKQNRPRGNRTWKTKLGHLNIRARFCQTVCPPSTHPSGNPYRFLQNGLITQTANLNGLIDWLNQLAPPPIKELVTPKKPIQPAQGNDLLAAVKDAWPTVLSVFAHFGMAAEVKQEHDGELRLLGNGGLLLTSDCSQFYCFSDQFGGGVIEAWGFCRVGSAYDKHKHFRQMLLEMATAASIDVAKFYKRGDEAKTESAQTNTRYWAEQYSGYWSLAR